MIHSILTTPASRVSRTFCIPADRRVRRPRIGQPVAGGNRVGSIQCGRVAGVERHGNATLRLDGVGILQCRLGHQQNIVPSEASRQATTE